MVLLALFITSPIYTYAEIEKATTLLHGTIRDEKGIPLPSATIRIARGGTIYRKGVSDKEGRYQAHLPEGLYLVEVSFTGYKTIRKQVIVKDKSVQQDFRLQELSTSLEEVTIIAKSQQEKMKEEPLTALSMEVQPISATLIDLGTLVHKASGVRLRESGGVGSDFNLSIHGLGGNSIRYFIDGIPLSSLGSAFSLRTLPINLINRVDIYKGVVPAHLGMDALGGAVNIITRKALQNYLSTSVGVGSFHTYDLDLAGQYQWKPLRLFIRPSLAYSNSKNDYMMRDVEVWNGEKQEYEIRDTPRFHDAYRSWTTQLELGVKQAVWADEAFLSVHYSDIYKEIQTGTWQTRVIGAAHREQQAVRISARYDKRDFILEDLQVHMHLSYTRSHTLLTDTAYRTFRWNGISFPTGSTELRGGRASLRHTLRPLLLGRLSLQYAPRGRGTWGLNCLVSRIGNSRYDDLDQSFAPATDVLSKSIMGLTYSRDLWGNRWRVLFFLKDYIAHSEIYQEDDAYKTGSAQLSSPHHTTHLLSFGTGQRLKVAPHLSLKGSYERGVRLPEAREMLGNGESIIANVQLQPETAHNLNLTAYGAWTLGGSKQHIGYEVTCFGRRVQNYIQRFAIDDRISQYDNKGRVLVYGVEGEVRYQYGDQLSLTANATYLSERDRTPTDDLGRPNITLGCRMPNKPFLFGNLLASYAYSWRDRQLKMDLNYSYTHWFFLNWEIFGARETKARIPMQHNLDTSLTLYLRDGQYSIALIGSNLLNYKLYDNYMLQRPGRGIYCKLQVFI